MTELTDLYTHDGPFASVLVDVSTETESGQHELELRAREATTRLSEAGAPEAVVGRVREALSEPVRAPAPRSRFVVATPESVLLDEVLPERTSSPVVTWAPLPDLGGLLAHRSEGISFVLVEVDHTGGTVATYDSHAFDVSEERQVAGEEQYAQKVSAGGLSERRYAQTSENVWRDNAREVADVALSRVREGHRMVVVTGSPEQRGEILTVLEGAGADVVALDRSGATRDGGDEALTTEVRAVVEQHLEEKRRGLAALVAERVGQGRGVAVGVDAVLDALVQGQVQTLVVDRERLAGQTVRLADHPGLDVPGVPEDEALRADLVLVAAALRTDAEVVPPPHEVDQPVIGLLRWDESA